MFDSYKRPISRVLLDGDHPLPRLSPSALSFEQRIEDELIDFVCNALATMARLTGQHRSLNLSIDQLLGTPGYHR